MSNQIAVFAAAMLASSSAAAWFSEGHMMVAAVAWNGLTDASRARVSALLQKNPDYQLWVQGVRADKRDQIAFVTAATWPDVIKGKQGHTLEYTDDGEQPSDDKAGQNIGYRDLLQHRYWHFVDTPFSTDGTALVEPLVPNAKTQIRLFEAAIASTDVSDDIKSYDLVWLEHLVGDVHQPLHATSRFSKALPHGDRGGNLVMLCEKPCKEELHAFWDGIPGDSEDPEKAIAAASALAPADATPAAIDDEDIWIDESFKIAKQTVYEAPIKGGKGPYTLDDHYKSDAKTEAMNRVALAGARLANIINSQIK
ncbi:MAG TPA: S1/P1 nuclease [Steroidobacteraceae bacterium]|jgi:hypothetical protein|nr:S1/P1 nuclease [Steroidobacteraceae bacterium]